jgi:hypothetical protein
MLISFSGRILVPVADGLIQQQYQRRRRPYTSPPLVSMMSMMMWPFTKKRTSLFFQPFTSSTAQDISSFSSHYYCWCHRRPNMPFQRCPATSSYHYSLVATPDRRNISNHNSNRQMSSTAMEGNVVDETSSSNNNNETSLSSRKWNLNGLRKEVSRLTVRCHKKIGQARQRLEKAQQEQQDDTREESVTSSPTNIAQKDEHASEVQAWQTRLQQLNQLEVLLQDIKGKNVLLPDHIAALAIELQVNDQPDQQQQTEQGPKAKKDKGPKTMTAFRLPYRRFYTENKTEIRVSGYVVQRSDHGYVTIKVS